MPSGAIEDHLAAAGVELCYIKSHIASKSEKPPSILSEVF